MGGIFNCAMVLMDDEFRKQTENSFKKVAEPKAVLMQSLDNVSRKYCPKLDYFVAFSSAACGHGNADQTNYGWSNSVMERICEKRQADGLHGLAIQWGYVGEVGHVAEATMNDFGGLAPQSVESCLEVLDAALWQQESPVICSFVAALKNERSQIQPNSCTLISRLENIFGIENFHSISPDRKLSELGMDSMIQLELKQILVQEYDLYVTKKDLRTMTVRDLKGIEAGVYKGKHSLKMEN